MAPKNTSAKSVGRSSLLTVLSVGHPTCEAARICVVKFPILFKVASRLFVVPTSSAASERIWSVYDFIHTKRRNRLSTDKVDKLYANAAIEALLQKEADFARMMMEESLSDSSDKSQNECDSDNDVMINDT